MGGRTVVSGALIKPGATNLIPKIHVKRGDLVMLMSGSKQVGKGKTGKVLSVFPETGKIIVEGINIVTRATKAKTAMGKSGLIKQEAPIYASRVMLYSTKSKKAVRAEFRKKEEID
jgi:large subunit ribosomal protein L24